MSLPNARRTPCSACPWRRESVAGWLGPHTADEWFALVCSDQPIACHTSIEQEDNWDTPLIRQCAGSARYRANNAKMPRDPEVDVGPVDRVNIFSRPNEFLEHHKNGPKGL